MCEFNVWQVEGLRAHFTAFSWQLAVKSTAMGSASAGDGKAQPMISASF